MKNGIKELYFTEDKLKKQTEDLLNRISKFRRKVSFCISRPALIVLDMQRYFLSEESHAFIPSAKAIIKNVKTLQTTFLEKGLTVVQTKHINTNDDAKQMKRWWNDIIRPEHPLSNIIDELKDERVMILEKSQYDAFYETDLEKMLKERDVDQIIISGVMTHLCCETTARSAFVRGFEVIFPLDATATYNREFHISSIQSLSHGFAVITRTEDVIKRLREMR